MQLTRNNTHRVDRLKIDVESDHEPVHCTLVDKSASVQNGEGTCDLVNGVAYSPDQIAVVEDSPLQHTISFEQDPSCADRIQSLLELRRIIKRRKRAAIQRYFPRAKRPDGTYYCPKYEWYVKHYSTPYRVWKYAGTYKTYTLPKYRWINTGHLVVLTHTEYAEHMLEALPESNLRARRFWRTRLDYYRAHPRMGNSRYPVKWWEYTGGFWLVVDPGGHPYWRKRFKHVRYFYRDWPRIRQGWLTYRTAALKAIDVFNVQLANVKRELADASIGVAHYNACDAYADGGESLLSDQRADPKMLSFRPSDGDRGTPVLSTTFRNGPAGTGDDMIRASKFRWDQWTFTCFAGICDLGQSAPTEEFLQDPQNWIQLLGAHRVPQYAEIFPMSGSGLCPSLCSFVRCDPDYGDPDVVGLCNLSQEFYRIWASRINRVGHDWVVDISHHEWVDRGYSQRFHMGPSTRRAPIALDIKSAGFSHLIGDKVKEGTMALLALRPDQAEIALNLTRSIGELKDLPSSVRSGAEFLRWTSTVVSTRGHPHARYWEITQHFENGRTVTWVSKSPPSRAFIRKYAKILPDGRPKPGSLTVKKRQATRKTSMSVLAALYLAWKFGVEQTINDGNTIVREGWDWVLQVRRGLNIMLHRFRTIAKFITLRAVRNISDLPWTGRIGSVSSIPYPKEFRYSGHITDRIDLTRVYNAISRDDGGPIDYAEVQLSPDTTVSIPCVLSDHHKFAFEDPRYAPNVGMSLVLKDGTHLSRSLCEDLLELYNEQQLWGILSEEQKVPRAELYQRARIVCFARYEREQLKRAVDSKHMRNWFAWSQLTTAAWELFPCSFVIDWFITTRQWVQSITDAISAWITDIYPQSSLWTSIRNRIWYTPLDNVNISATAQLDPGPVSKWYMYGSYRLEGPIFHEGSTDYVSSIDAAAIRVPESLNLDYGYSIFWDYSQIKKSHMKRFQRAPVDEAKAVALPRVRCNVKLNIGKLSSLLAMFVSK